MKIVATAFVMATAVAGLSALIHGLWSLAHLSGRTSLMRMIVDGMRWFDEDNYTPRGKQLQRRFLRSLGVSFGCALGVVMSSALTGE